MQTDSPSAAGPAERSIPKTGAQIIVDALLAHGVETAFGYIGASVLPLFDRLYDSPIRFVVPCHEQGGAHMADANARANGRSYFTINAMPTATYGTPTMPSSPGRSVPSGSRSSRRTRLAPPSSGCFAKTSRASWISMSMPWKMCGR